MVKFGKLLALALIFQFAALPLGIGFCQRGSVAEVKIDPLSVTSNPLPDPVVQDGTLQDDQITINLAEQQNVDLNAFIRLLAQKRNMRILDDGQLGSNANKVQFFGKTVVTADTLFELVQGVLRSNDLAIVQADVNGWYRVVKLANVRPFAPTGDPANFSKAEYVTGVFVLKDAAAEEVKSYLDQLVYVGGRSGNAITLIPSKNTVIVTERAAKLRTISELIEEIDKPQEEIRTQIYTVKHLEVTELETQLRSLLNLGSNPAPAANTSSDNRQNTTSIQPAGQLRIVADARTNRLIMFGTSKQISRALESIELIDVVLDIRFQRYQFTHISASRIDELVKQSLGSVDEALIDKIFKSSINEQSNELLVTARDEIHDRISELADELDKKTKVSKVNNPVQFYTLKNVQAVDILDTLQSIVRRIQGNDDPRRLNGINARPGFNVNGPNNFPGNLGGVGTNAPFNQNSPFNNQVNDGSLQSAFQGSGSSNDVPGVDQTAQSQVGGLSDLVSGLGPSPAAVRQSGNIIPGEARITVDENSNTLIVVAEPPVQQLYADLIERLDRRPPQVLIEVLFVTINTTEDFQFGLDVAGGDRTGDSLLFAFSSFGLSAIDAGTGVIGSIAAGDGFNGTLIDPDIADVVVRALYSKDGARVVTAPKILVNDNTTGVTSSVVEQPFTSINNAGNTVATTSFGGFVEAGTTISVTPQISDDDYLNLEFDILLNSFLANTGADTSVPPPRTTQQVTSQVAIPNGHTVVVGGLSTKSFLKSYDGIPWLEKIPLLRSLAGNQSEDIDESRIFVFIKPTILRDDKFRDLQYISELDRKKACLPNDAPSSKALLIK